MSWLVAPDGYPKVRRTLVDCSGKQGRLVVRHPVPGNPRGVHEVIEGDLLFLVQRASWELALGHSIEITLENTDGLSSP